MDESVARYGHLLPRFVHGAFALSDSATEFILPASHDGSIFVRTAAISTPIAEKCRIALQNQELRVTDSESIDQTNGLPPWRRFPAVWGRVQTPQLGYPLAEKRLLEWLEGFIDLMQPQRLHPYVWVVSQVERVVNANGRAWWVAFCYVSDRAEDVHENAALIWENGAIIRRELQRIRYGEVEEFVLIKMIAENHPDLVPIPRD
jgi:hypothetical protein